MPTLAWQAGILGGSHPSSDVNDFPRSVTRTVLDVAASEVADPVLTRPDGEIDRWSCLGAALLEPYVVGSLPGVAQPSDRATLERLGQLLADPAAALCRAAARDMFDAA